MHYYLYEIRNILNDKIYVGVHKTKNLDDGYMGSGKVIRRAIEKYGVENFTKVILETFEDATSMYAREKEVVTDEFLAREDTYNLRRGGTGGFDFINKNVLSTEDRKRNGKLGAEVFDKIYGSGALVKQLRSAQENRTHDSLISSAKKSQMTLLKKNGIKGGFAGKKHSDEFRNMISAANKIHQRGINNHQYGTCWIYNESGNKKIKKDDLQQYLDAGYVKGRKVKWGEPPSPRGMGGHETKCI